MQSLPHFIQSLKSLEQNIYLISTHLEPLMLNHRVSDQLEEKLTTPEIHDHISLITNHLENCLVIMEFYSISNGVAFSECISLSDYN
ncbi:hypothetical protein BK011_09750 [Tenericutes bacterium MZ-XQ]|nr:hypothetical protein BK011_09750 [Tenericutes bacterium MZ-XQ]